MIMSKIMYISYDIMDMNLNYDLYTDFQNLSFLFLNLIYKVKYINCLLHQKVFVLLNFNLIEDVGVKKVMERLTKNGLNNNK